MGLTLKQSKFCFEFLRDGNGTHAAIRAGCPPAGASVTACRWLAMDKIKDEITRLRAEAGEFAGAVTLERTLAELAKVAFIDPSLMYGENGELLSPHQMPINVRAAIAGIDTIEMPGGVGNVKKVKLVDKSRALDMLMKHTGGYEKDNTQKQSKIIIIDIIDDDEELPNEGDPDSALPNNETGINEDEFIDE
jgi:phage terminase small subunit